MKTWKSKILILMLIDSGGVAAQNASASSKHPIYIDLQYAGNVGVASIGLGTAVFHKRINVGLVYGYLPKSMNGAEVHTIAIRGRYRYLHQLINNVFYSSFSAGFNVNFAITHNSYLIFPDYYPKGYYAPNAIHIAPFLRQELSFQPENSIIEKVGLYFELGTLDKYLWILFNSGHVSFMDMVNVAVGLSIEIKQFTKTKTKTYE